MFEAIEDQPVFKNYYFYADSEEVQKVLQLAEKAVSLFDTAKENGFANGRYFGAVSLALGGIVKVEGDPRSDKCKLVVNKEGIATEMHWLKKRTA